MRIVNAECQNQEFGSDLMLSAPGMSTETLASRAPVSSHRDFLPDQGYPPGTLRLFIRHWYLDIVLPGSIYGGFLKWGYPHLNGIFMDFPF